MAYHDEKDIRTGVAAEGDGRRRRDHEQGGAPDVRYTVAAVDGTFNADGTPTSTHGQVITGEDYATRYGQAEPNMCQGADLTACMDETLEFDTP